MKDLPTITLPRQLNKIPRAELPFSDIEVASTTVGDAGADALAVNAGFGKSAPTAEKSSLLAFELAAQLRSRSCELGRL